MPKIRNLRIINAQFNEAAREFQDLRMPFYSESATYELINGGGKSVLLMLLIQCVTPNASLDHKKPLKDIFRGGNPNRTTHVLVEWELDEGLYEHKYLLTGFCAKKKNNPDDLDKNGTPDYFNYICLYDDPNDFDIHRIPLCRFEDDVFVSIDISKTRDLLRENSGKYNIWIAENKRDYIEMIKKFNLLEVEMDLIRHINKKENYLKSHFTENYGNSRSLIEKMLLEITEKCLKSKKSIYNDESIESSNESLASALYQSQKDIKRLKEETERLEEYEKLGSEIHIIASANDEVIEKFSRFEDIKQQAACQFQTYKVKVSEKRIELEKTNGELDNVRRQHAKAEIDIERLEITKLNATVNIGKKEQKSLENQKEEIHQRVKKLENEINFAIATNKYLKIQELEEEIHKDETTLKNMKKEHEELFEKRNVLGQKLRSYLEKAYNETKEKHNDKSKELIDLQQKLYDHREYIGIIKADKGQKEEDLFRLKNEKNELSKKEIKLQSQYLTFPKITGGLILNDEIAATVNRIKELDERDTKTDFYIHQENYNLAKVEGESDTIRSEIEHLTEKLDLAEKSYSSFISQKDAVLKVLKARSSENLPFCLKQIEDEIKTTNKEILSLEQKKEILSQEIDTIREHGSSLSEDMKTALKWFKSELGFAKAGAEYLKELEEGKQKEILVNAPWLTKSIILTRQDFNRVVNSPAILPAFIMDSSVILTNQSSLQEQKKLSLGDIFLPSRDEVHYIKLLDSGMTIKRIERDIVTIELNLKGYNTTLGMANDDRDTIKLFIDKYPVDFESQIQREISTHKEALEKENTQLTSLLESVSKIKANLEQKDVEKKSIRAEIDLLNKKMDILKELDEVVATSGELDISTRECESKIKELDIKSRLANEKTSRLELELNGKESLVTGLHDRVKELQRELEPLDKFNIVNIESLSEEEVKNLRPEFDSLNDIIARIAGDASSLEKGIKDNKGFVNDLWVDIYRNKISKETLLSSERNVSFSEDYIEQLEVKKESVESTLLEFENTVRIKTEQQIRLEKGFEDRILNFNKISIEPYATNDSLLDDTPYDSDIKTKRDERIRFSEQINKLDLLRLKIEIERDTLENNQDRYRDLDSFYQFSSFETVIVEELIDYNKMSSLLKNISEQCNNSKKDYESVKAKSIDTIRKLKVPPDFIDTIKDKLKIPGSLREAELIGRSLKDYLMIIESKTEVQKELVDSLKHVEEKVASQALGIAMIYKDYLKRFPSLSRIILDGKSTDMIRINFDDCEYTDEMAMSEIKHYIQQLIEDIESQKITQKELVDYLMPVHLINKVLDMKNISLSIRKIDTNDTKFQRWEKIQASDGQENAMFIIFMVVLMSYIRDIVVDRKDRNTSKVLIIDNPFGSTSACYLWEKIAAILEKNNVQIICPGHKISPSVSEYFPVRHILTEETSTDGRVRVNVKTSAKNEVMDKIEQQKRYGQLSFENYN